MPLLGGWKLSIYSLKLVRAHMYTYEADVITYVNTNPNPNPNPNPDKKYIWPYLFA